MRIPLKEFICHEDLSEARSADRAPMKLQNSLALTLPRELLKDYFCKNFLKQNSCSKAFFNKKEYGVSFEEAKSIFYDDNEASQYYKGEFEKTL